MSMKRSYIREILDCITEDTISFAGGLPNENIFPLKEIQQSANRVLEQPLSLQYSKSQGLDSLRQKIADMYTKRFNFPTNKDEILITTGSQQAFDIISKIFIKKSIYVQSPSYIGALSAFNALKLEVKTFKSIEDLKYLQKVDAVYIMSDYQNPSTFLYSSSERKNIQTVLNNHVLIEDGAYSLLNFEGEVSEPISKKHENSFHMGSFSKVIAPGLRVGWIRTKKENIEKLLISKEAIDLHTPTLNQMIINDYLENNNIENHLKIVREDYSKRMEFMALCMQKYLKNFIFEKPKGGMFIYGKFEGVDSMNLAKKALEHDVAFVPAEVFFVFENKSSYARFNFTNASFEEIEKGIKQLAKIV